MTESSYQSRTQQFEAEISQYRPPEIAATLLEQLALTKQPILNSEIRPHPSPFSRGEGA